MKQVALIFLVLSVFVASCKKTISDPDVIKPVDPRDNVVGTYSVVGNIRIAVNGGEFTPISTTGTISVSKPVATTATATNTSQLVIAVDLPDLKDSFNAELKNNTYTVTDQKTDRIFVLNDTFTGPLIITGLFTDKGEITFSSSAEAKGNFVVTKKRDVTGSKKL